MDTTALAKAEQVRIIEAQILRAWRDAADTWTMIQDVSDNDCAALQAMAQHYTDEWARLVGVLVTVLEEDV